jgi:hypothetical protein
MTSMLIAPVDLSPALSGGPSLIVASGLPETEALAQAGLEFWEVSGGAGGMGPLLHRPGADPAGAAEGAVPLGFAPMGVVAILAMEAEQAAPLLRWWQAITDAPPPPLVVAPDGRAALAELAGILGRALQAAESRCAGLLGQLAATRADYEETRVAMAAVTRVLGQRPTAGLRSLLSTRPSQTGLKLGAAGRPLLLTQTMGVPVTGLAALALHLAEAVILDPGVAVLRLRLLGAESGRTFGAWDVPGAALSAPGWLVLDLPSPIGPVAETARLTLAAELGPDDQLALSLDDFATSPAMAVAGPEVPPGGDRALALKLWTSEFGNRFVAARHWNWDEAGLELPIEATPFVLPAEAWQEVRVVAGSCRLIALGEEAPRPVATLAGSGAETLVLLPLPPGIPAADVLRLDLTLQLGEPGQAQAAAWILPAEVEVGGTEDLGAALRWSGWRGFAPEETALSITMSLPPSAPRTEGLQLAVLLRGSADQGVCSVEIGGLSVMALTAAAPAATAPVPEPLAPVETMLAPSIAAVRVHEHFRGDGNYEHLDISLIGLEAPANGLRVPEMRFKIYHSGGPLMIEFRRAAGWPDVFDHWREIRSDKWGSIFEFSAASASKALEGIDGTRDGALLSALLALLPAIAARAARGRRAERSEVDAWADRARVFAEKVQLAMSRQGGVVEQASAVDQE